jgi:hypothetical protein
MISYAQRWWFGFIPLYIPGRDEFYSDDCTDFVSQALYFSGWWQTVNIDPRNKNYWYSGILMASPFQSHTWMDAEDLTEYGLYVSGHLQLVNNSLSTSQDPPGIQAGDVAFWIFSTDKGFGTHSSKGAVWDHSTIVTAVDTSGLPYFTEHSWANYNKPLASMLRDGGEQSIIGCFDD